jgi:hypothetical protein
MSSASDPLSLDPLGPMGFGPAFSGPFHGSTSNRLGLDPLSPTPETGDSTPHAPTSDQAHAGRKATS